MPASRQMVAKLANPTLILRRLINCVRTAPRIKRADFALIGSIADEAEPVWATNAWKDETSLDEKTPRSGGPTEGLECRNGGNRSSLALA